MITSEIITPQLPQISPVITGLIVLSLLVLTSTLSSALIHCTTKAHFYKKQQKEQEQKLHDILERQVTEQKHLNTLKEQAVLFNYLMQQNMNLGAIVANRIVQEENEFRPSKSLH